MKEICNLFCTFMINYAELRWINVLRFCQLIFLTHYSAHAGVNSHFFLAKFYQRIISEPNRRKWFLMPCIGHFLLTTPPAIGTIQARSVLITKAFTKTHESQPSAC